MQSNSTQPLSVPDELAQEFPLQYLKLWEKIKKYYPNHPEILGKFEIINKHINSLLLDIESFSINLDQNRFDLTPAEEKAIEEYYELDRNLDRLKPFAALVTLASFFEQEALNKQKCKKDDELEIN